MNAAGRRKLLFLSAIVATGATATAVAISLSACDLQSCSEVQDDYEQAVTTESGLIPLDEEGPPHLAMAMRLDFVNELTSGLIDTAISDTLRFGGDMEVSGETVGFSLGSTGAALQMEASDACDGCLRVFGDFDGDVEVDLPAVGTRSSPLSGAMDWVVPLDVGRDGDDAAIFLDLPEAVNLGMPAIEARLPELSDSWSEPVATALAAEMGDRLAERLDPIRLVGYALPDFGLGGLEITPSLFHLDGGSNSVVLGIRTNTDVQAGEFGDTDFVDALSLEDGQNVALGVQPGFVVEAVRLGLRDERIPRRYGLSGRARDDGPARAVVDALSVGAHEADGIDLGLDFRLFSFSSNPTCFSMNGTANSRLALDGDRAIFDVEDVEFTGAGGITDAANWASAEFVESSASVVNRSLESDVLSSSGLGFDLRGDRLSTGAGMLVLRGIGSAE